MTRCCASNCDGNWKTRDCLHETSRGVGSSPPPPGIMGMHAAVQPRPSGEVLPPAEVLRTPVGFDVCDMPRDQG